LQAGLNNIGAGKCLGNSAMLSRHPVTLTM
jgi:hypothetical protein